MDNVDGGQKLKFMLLYFNTKLIKGQNDPLKFFFSNSIFKNTDNIFFLKQVKTILFS